MLRGRPLSRALVLAAALLWASPAAASEIIGDACTGSGSSASLAQAVDATYDGNNTVCNGSVWQYPAYQFGSTAASCNGTNAGIVQWTGSAFQGCDGSIWGSLGGGSALSALLAATTTNSIDSTNNAQTWAWGTLSTETALTLTTSSITTGALLNLSGTARPPTRAPCLK